jgi:CRP-like cAMP-binding protein
VDHQAIIANVSRHTEFTSAELDVFSSQLVLRQIEKRDYLLRARQPTRKIFYVLSGALRAFYVDKTGRESTIMFAVADWWVTDMYCFLNAKPAMLTIEAIEESRVFELSKTGLDHLYKEVPKFERCFRILFQNAYTREQLRVIEGLSLPAEERYLNFLRKYPQILPHITQKQIASYLGITPEFLSLLRKNQRKKSIT